MNFNLNRFGRLVRRDWLVFQKPIGYAVLALCIFLLGLIFYEVGFNEYEVLSMRFWSKTFSTLLLVGSGLITSIIFWEFKDPAGRISYLSLPASHLEKVVSRIIYSFILFPLALLIIFFILFKLTEIFDGPVFMDVDLKHFVGTVYAAYIIIHAIVFMFAVWLNKYVAPKSAIITCVCFMVISLLVMLIFRVIFSEHFVGWEMSGNFRMAPKDNFQQRVEQVWAPFMNKVVPLVLLLWFWTIAYYKMTEKQV